MALFDEDVTITPRPRRTRPRGAAIGIWSLTVALVVLLVLTFLPTAYVIQRPGPVFNTLGTSAAANGEKVPLIAVDGAKTYPTSGTLDLLTVETVGNRERTPSWLELAAAWLDPSRAVLPLDAVFPAGQSSTEREQQSTEMMVDSQKKATAAALTHLGYKVTPKLTVYSVIDGAPADGTLRTGDVITAADGTAVTDVDTLRAVIDKAAGRAVLLSIERDGRREQVSVTPTQQTTDGKTSWIIGVTLVTDFDFPIDVTIQLNNVGGPSAGMMFSLGIIDTLTPGYLNGGKDVAGTGTIDADGDVGPIGGIRQKLYGAKDAGARYFLAPASNCDEVAGHVPSGLRVFSVKTLEDSLAVLDALDHGGDLGALPTCAAK
nr:PDZ domain-containing protein [Microbacterium bovistercoris]